MRPTTPVRVVVLIGAASMIAIGTWCRIDPAGFADWAGWPHHEHFLHDAGIFQVAIGLMMCLAVWLRDAVSIGLAGFVFTSALHAHNHYVDRADGGRDGDWIQLFFLAALGGVALFLHLRSQRHVKAPDATRRWPSGSATASSRNFLHSGGGGSSNTPAGAATQPIALMPSCDTSSLVERGVDDRCI